MSNSSFNDFEFIRVEDRGSVRLVKIDRPAKANALNSRALAELSVVVQATAQDEAIRLFALTGAGQKVFCAGADLSEARGETADSRSAKAYDQRWDELSGRIAALPCPTAALINGACIGGGLSIALAFDFRLGADGAYFRYPAAQHGFMPSSVDLGRLTAAAGVAVVRKMLLLGETVSMSVALSKGLADEMLEDDHPWTALDRLADLITSGQTRSQTAIKRLIAAGGNSARVTDDCYRAVYDFDRDSLDRLRNNSAPYSDDGGYLSAGRLPRSADDADA